MAWKEAFELSPSEVRAATPPGTVILLDHGTDVGIEGASNNGIFRQPQPSSDPRDPLNFPFWRKLVALFMVSFYAFVANFTSSGIAPALQLWNFTFPHDPRSYSELSTLVAINILFLGASNIWWVPLSNWIGRRPVLILASLLMTCCTIWCGVAPSFHSLFAARLLQGAGGGAADSVAPVVAGEMFFVHQRGRAMGVYTVFLSLGPFVGGLAGGYIAFNKGWEYTFWVGTALSVFSFFGMAIFVPETLFERPIYQTDPSQEDQVNDSKAQSERIEDVNPTEQKHLTFIQSLGFGPVRGNILTLAIRPWKSLYLPGTLVVMLHYAGLVGGVVTISTIGAQLVAEPPYLWGANAGLINVGGLIGTALGYIYTHFTSDRIVRRQVRKNSQHGVTEAEHRLPTMFFPLAITTSGFFVFGFCAQNPGPYRWIGLEAGFAMLSFGLMQVPSVGFNYLVDSYHSLAADCLTMVTILRAIIAFSWTFFVAHWIEERGVAEPFGIFGMLMGIFGLLTVPLWLFGKRMRIATASSVERWSR